GRPDGGAGAGAAGDQHVRRGDPGADRARCLRLARDARLGRGPGPGDGRGPRRAGRAACRDGPCRRRSGGRLPQRCAVGRRARRAVPRVPHRSRSRQLRSIRILVSGCAPSMTPSIDLDPPPSLSEPATLLVAIVNYRTADLTIDCLRSLAVAVVPPVSARVVVADCASGDGSAARIGAAIHENGWGGWASVVPLPRNGGFAYGTNALIRPALQSPTP